MTNNESGKFRGSWMFDTHDATYYLNESGEIIGIHCDKIRNQVIGIQTSSRVGGYIGNPGVFALSEASEIDCDRIFEELTRTYSQRIKKWVDGGMKELDKAA